jgi:SAM-dependent methyltransferase
LYKLLTRHLNLALVDLSENFTRFNKIQYPQFKSVVADATRYGNQIQDQALIILNSSYHHIPDNNKKEFLENISQNLKIGGRVIMGENFLPKYKSSNDRVLSVKRYYKKLLIFYHSILEEMPKQDIIDRKNLTDSIDLIKEVKKRDLNRYGEFKTDLKTFIDILPKGFKILEISQVWPLRQTIKISQTVQIPNNYYGSGVLLLEKK